MRIFSPLSMQVGKERVRYDTPARSLKPARYRWSGAMNAAQKKAEAITAVKRNAQESGLEFFHDRWRESWATVPVNGHKENWRVNSPELRSWVEHALYRTLGCASKEWVRTILEGFRLQAIYEGPKLGVHVRTAQDGDTLYIDTGNEFWQAIEVTADGWKLINQPPVKFSRQPGMAAMPDPVRGGNARDLFQFLNVSPQHEVLILAWLTHALRPNVPYPVLAFTGVQDSGKTTATKILRALTDPAEALVSGAPNGPRDLVMSTTNGHVIALDNLSEIPPKVSDLVCQIAIGGSHRERKYHTNDGSERIFTFRQPVIVNGIEQVIQRPDLLNRSLLIHVEPITQVQRNLRAATFDAEFGQAQPRLLGALLDVLCTGLRNLPRVAGTGMPRMIDFGRWGVAIEEFLGFSTGSFLAGYRANIQHGESIALEASPIAWPLHEYLSRRTEFFDGSSTELLEALVKFTTDVDGKPTVARRNPAFPKSAEALSAQIDRIQPNLAKLGITVERRRTNRKRFIRLLLRDVVTPSDGTHSNSASPSNSQETEGMAAGVTQ